MCFSPAVPPYPGRKATAETPRRWTRNHLRRLILQTAHQLLLQEGARKFTVKGVAAKAGVARSTIYEYFGPKAGLLAACREFAGHQPGRATRRAIGGYLACVNNPPHQPTYGRRWPQVPGAGPRRTNPVTNGLYVWLQWGLQRLTEDDGDLYLLATAEAVRSVHSPAAPRGRGRWPEAPHPLGAGALLPVRLRMRLREWVVDAQRSGELRDDLPAATLVQWLEVFYWHQLLRQGPLRDDPGRPAAVTAPCAWPDPNLWLCWLQGIAAQPRQAGVAAQPRQAGCITGQE